MSAKLLVLSALLLSGAAGAMTNDQLRAKPAKVSFVAPISEDKAIACLLEDNSLTTQTIRGEGFTDLAMYMGGARMVLATLYPVVEGVRVEGRGMMAKLLLSVKPCMGLPRDPKARLKMG